MLLIKNTCVLGANKHAVLIFFLPLFFSIFAALCNVHACKKRWWPQCDCGYWGKLNEASLINVYLMKIRKIFSSEQSLSMMWFILPCSDRHNHTPSLRRAATSLWSPKLQKITGWTKTVTTPLTMSQPQGNLSHPGQKVGGFTVITYYDVQSVVQAVFSCFIMLKAESDCSLNPSLKRDYPITG